MNIFILELLWYLFYIRNPATDHKIYTKVAVFIVQVTSTLLRNIKEFGHFRGFQKCLIKVLR